MVYLLKIVYKLFIKKDKTCQNHIEYELNPVWISQSKF